MVPNKQAGEKKEGSGSFKPAHCNVRGQFRDFVLSTLRRSLVFKLSPQGSNYPSSLCSKDMHVPWPERLAVIPDILNRLVDRRQVGDYDSFTERGRTTHVSADGACHALWTTPEGSRLGMGCRREPSRVGSRSSHPAGSGLRRPGGAINCRCKSVRWIKQYVPWPTDIVVGAADSQPPLEEAHWDVIPRCRKIASMRPSCILIRWGVRGPYVELNYGRTNVHP
ncbi:hypothetical protein EVAR_88025_1 [Eumeta japonica]|uniref:Uncharacterized protein n=1 Tax=Eumeta variegata TaxID=151549 RepID=A0A4C1VFJ6_EUMVA|nr:hypothetical protein EVAR_88025_1 [Eumeta japonica]